MTHPDETDAPSETFTDLPLQPTGSGVADLEIAYEQMKLAEAAGADPGRDKMGGGSPQVDIESLEAAGDRHPS